MELKQVPVCTCAIISNIPKSISKDHLNLKIEKYCGSNSVADIGYEQGRGFASIKFNDPSGMKILSFLVRSLAYLFKSIVHLVRFPVVAAMFILHFTQYEEVFCIIPSTAKTFAIPSKI